MNVPFLDLKVQYKQIEHEVLPMVTEVMTNGAFIGGPQVLGFEKEFAEFCESKYCAGVNSGTDSSTFSGTSRDLDSALARFFRLAT